MLQFWSLTHGDFAQSPKLAHKQNYFSQQDSAPNREAFYSNNNIVLGMSKLKNNLEETFKKRNDSIDETFDKREDSLEHQFGKHKHKTRE